MIRAAALAAVLPLAGGALPAPAAPAAEPPVHEVLDVRLEPGRGDLEISARLRIHAAGRIRLALGARFEVRELRLDGAAVHSAAGVARDRRVWPLQLGEGADPHVLSLRYRARLAPPGARDQREVLGPLPPTASARGSYLPADGGWYPEIEGLSFDYRLRLDLPAGQRGLVPGRLLRETEAGGRHRAEFAFEHPARGIDLMAGPYRVQEQRVTLADGRSVRLRTWFHPGIADLAAGYLEAARGYLERYSRLIGPYPFAGFSVVSSPLPTGFGMPSLTYLGIEVLRLPFIRATSLGHEVLHNWWGNGVYVEWRRGNWCEGLTTLMADYAFAEDRGADAARAMRLSWLRDFAALPPERDVSLRAFTARLHDASQIVGYGKAAFVFLMLRDRIGADAFREGLRGLWRSHRFRRAAWADLERAFERASGADLGPFFAQWLARTGAPEVRVAQARAHPDADGFRIELTLAQRTPAWSLQVPVAVRTAQGEVRRRLALERGRQDYTLRVPAAPRSLRVDPDFRLFRALAPAERPPILRDATLDADTVVALAGSGGDFERAARALAARLLDVPPRLAGGADLPPGAPLVVLGLEAELDAFLDRHGLAAPPAEVAGRGSARVWTARRADGAPLLVISARDPGALRALLRPLPHYGRRSWLVFEGARAVALGTWPARAPAWRFAGEGR